MFALTRPIRSRGQAYPLGAFIESFFPDSQSNGAALVPALDFVETPDSYITHVELPGIAPEAIAVSIHDGVLEISGEKTAAVEQESDNWRRVERNYGAFSRTVSLPGEVVADKVTAQSRHGVLTITLPKAESQKPHKINIDVS